MSAQYVMQEMVDFRHEGGTLLYPRMVMRGCRTTEELVRFVTRDTTFGAGEVRGALALLARGLAEAMASGYSVRLEGIGRFTPSLSLKKGRGRESADGTGTRRNAASIQVGGVNFSPDKELLRELNRLCRLERASGTVTRRRSPYTPAERLALALDYLQTNPVLRVAGYAALTGLSRTVAGKELRLWSEDPASGLAAQGTGSHRVYVRRAGS